MSSATNSPAKQEARRGRIRTGASIARSITWSFWWRKVVSWLLFDVLVVCLLGVLFSWHCVQELPTKALDGITLTRGGLTLVSPASSGFSGTGLDVSTWVYTVFGGDGKTYRFALEPYLTTAAPVLIFMLVFELFDVIDFYSDTRRVRRQLQPLNDLAVLADSIGNAGVVDPMASAGDESKMATLEQAIARASVDSPTVTTGDKDLRSIEVALNGLLRQMQEAKLQQMRFVSDASHELRTPIAVIQGYVNMLDRWGAQDEEVLHESIEALKSESAHMQELVEQLLFLARGDSGRNTLQRTRLNMAALVREVSDESDMIDDDHAYECGLGESDLADERFALDGDVAMLKQVLRIIVQNAQKYSPAGMTIRLDATAGVDGVSCSVTDEGIGMSEEDASHVFERFYRADNAREDGAQGSGLGLAIAKWIVDAHGGSIEVLSREGVGTRFTVTIPKTVREV